ncbi:MAG: hypothetical protein RTV72_02280 [Candidatus Thorarchaeota archaeon]
MSMMPDSFHPEIVEDDRKIRIESLGRVITSQNRRRFERMLREIKWSGTIDISGWTLDAVKSLVFVCADEKLSITIKHGSRYFMPICFPKKHMLESFAEAIIDGKF